jgi:hypothetical protein
MKGLCSNILPFDEREHDATARSCLRQSACDSCRTTGEPSGERDAGASLPLPGIPLAFYSTHTKSTPKQDKWHKLMRHRGENDAACG